MLNYKLYARRLYLIGLAVGASPTILEFNSSLSTALLSFFLLFVVVCLFVAFPCVHHHEHLVLAFFCFLVCFNNILFTYQKKYLSLNKKIRIRFQDQRDLVVMSDKTRPWLLVVIIFIIILTRRKKK